jgi:hypothetical protein
MNSKCVFKLLNLALFIYREKPRYQNSHFLYAQIETEPCARTDYIVCKTSKLQYILY